ncbi:tRNA lysidine(34) synthetase TilS [Phreatobacter cathodiphilus]|uniref:tRNA(Ile)-lysidine synthase n=1 Tax=Phreatobacter cathodiphilus TaxID=1868589 RepID=A0A2S0NBQ3_9HYPH|nr:tRNA lysidine(34) synthetase TilS [Phreatobacter cathodiphilus]AVO45588.1 tRNA lysidine(34) synthetase TilS [Phreatobacter cathodiphilus]
MPAAEAEAAAPLADDDIRDLLSSLPSHDHLVLAVSGGPDSCGMMAAFARWRDMGGAVPALSVACVDHGLRPAAAAECAGVVAAAAGLGLTAQILRWEGGKPASGLQEAAREARYRLLADHARAVGAGAIVVAHHLEDQAETVLMRLARGSGPLGLKGMATASRREGMDILRPFLWVPKARLAATAGAAGLVPVDDPSNRDPGFTRVRLRQMLPALADEGLDAERLAILAGRIRMIEDALARHAADLDTASRQQSVVPGTVVFDATGWLDRPFIDVQQLLAAVLREVAPDGARERLEALEALAGAVLMAIAEGGPLRQTLQGALVTVTAAGRVIVAREPPRQPARRSD